MPGLGECLISHDNEGLKQYFIDARVRGRSWADIANEQGLKSPSAARNRFTEVTGSKDYKTKGEALRDLIGGAPKQVAKAIDVVEDIIKAPEFKLPDVPQPKPVRIGPFTEKKANGRYQAPKYEARIDGQSQVVTIGGREVRFVNRTNEMLNSKQVQEMAHGLDMAFRVSPPPPGFRVNVISKQQSVVKDGLAYVNAKFPNQINVVKENMRRSGARENRGWLAPSYEEVEDVTYTMVHEYGHVWDFTKGDHPRFPNGNLDPTKLRARPAFGASDVSRYAATDHFEATAESFAEWAISRGDTRIDYVRKKAEKGNWRRP